MVRIAIVAVLLGVACAAAGDEKDPVKEKLFAAKVTYDKEMAAFRKAANEWLDKREDAARNAGDKKALDVVKVDRKAFDEDGLLPKTAPADVQQKSATARKKLEAAYAQAVKEYIKAKKDDEATAIETEWKTFARGNTVDLLALTDPKVHAVAGGWKLDGKALVNESGDKTLQLPYEPGSEYDVEVACQRVAGKECLAIGLIADGRPILALIDGWPGFGYRSGFHLVDGKEASGNVTTVNGEWLKTGKDYTVKSSVRDGKIDVFVNGKVVTSYKGDFARLSVPEGNSGPNKKALFLRVGVNTTFRIERILVTPLKGKGTILK